METQQRGTTTCPPPTSPAHAAQVVVAGAVAITAGATAVVALGGNAVLATLVAVVIALLAAVVARRTLGSLFAGLTLQLARPYTPGEQVRLFVPAIGKVTEAEVIRLGVVSTTLGTSDGLLVVPNAHMLRAAPECREAA
ncbi:hypothetical protein [uncultured Jatrophihabitans sp.]|uniref:hypothetical protein n=1 Tax=uncultured Jatrophihabitans sp. TaxID=1610747 RepID=UPI0035CB8F13